MVGTNYNFLFCRLVRFGAAGFKVLPNPKSLGHVALIIIIVIAIVVNYVSLHYHHHYLSS